MKCFLITLINSRYDMTPGNYWYGNKYYYMKNVLGQAPPPICPDFLTKKNAKFTNQDEVEDLGLQVQCVDEV